MKRRVLFGFSVMLVLLFGCLGIGVPSSTVPSATGLIPNKADGYAVIKIASIFNDKDVKDAIEKNQSVMEDIAKAEKEAGINFRKMDALVFFFNTEKLSGNMADYYLGMIIIGEYNKETVLAKIRENNTVSEETYEGYAIYATRSNLRIGEYGMGSAPFTALALLTLKNSYVQSTPPEQSSPFTDTVFLDEKTIVIGSRASVRDVIDVKKGKQKAMENADVKRIVSVINKDAMLVVASKIPESARQGIKEDEKSVINVAAFKKINTAGFSFNKAGDSVEFKLAMLFDDASSASKASKAIEGVFNLYSAFVKSGSSLEKLMNAIKVSADGTLARIELTTTTGELKKVGEEIGEMMNQTYANTQYNGYGTKPENRCDFPVGGVYCSTHRVKANTSSGATLSIVVVNTLGKKIYVTGLGCSAEATETPSLTDLRDADHPDGIVLKHPESTFIPPPASSYLVYCYDLFGNKVVSEAGEYYTGKVILRYNEDTPTGLEHTIVGDLSARLVE